jgi:hypothetical protein
MPNLLLTLMEYVYEAIKKIIYVGHFVRPPVRHAFPSTGLPWMPTASRHLKWRGFEITTHVRSLVIRNGAFA